MLGMDRDAIHGVVGWENTGYMLGHYKASVPLPDTACMITATANSAGVAADRVINGIRKYGIENRIFILNAETDQVYKA